MNNHGSAPGETPAKPPSKVPLPPTDGRSAEAKWRKRLRASIIDDHLGHAASEAESVLIDRIIALYESLKPIHAQMLRGEGEDVDMENWFRISNALHNAETDLGILPLKPRRRRYG